ncbi:MAG: DUF86 domain-containing protein [Verrucomicrobiota bacterium]|nr:DUF86 domain-containing protein [Verrucomicrobiota bacterium]
MQHDEAFVLDILNAAETARKFGANVTKKEFLDNPLVQSGILHQIIIIGEAVKRLSPEYRKNHPKIPWKLIAGMRDRVIHGYFDVDLGEVWNTVEKDLPELIKYLKPLVPTKK